MNKQNLRRAIRTNENAIKRLRAEIEDDPQHPFNTSKQVQINRHYGYIDNYAVKLRDYDKEHDNEQ